MIRIGTAELELHDWGCTTHFADGSRVSATPHSTPHYHVVSHRVGLGDDILRYCHTHEAMHLFAEHWLHERPSRVLWALAHGKMLSGREATYEELAAQAMQRWLFANERPISAGVDWDAFKAAALEVLS